MNTINSDQVRSVNLFSQVSEANLPRLLKAASLTIAPSRAVLFVEGDHPDALYTLIVGTVELFSRHHDRRCTVSILQCARPFMLSSIFGGRYHISARTLEPSRLLVVPIEVIRELIATDLAFARQAARELASDYHLVVADFKNSRLTTTIERLADWMLRSDSNAGGSGRFAMAYDKRTLASYLGISPEHLSRNLATLSSAGVLVRGRRVTLNNPKALASIAKHC